MLSVQTRTPPPTTSNRKHVPLSKGNLHKLKVLMQDVTLSEIDAANARPQGSQDITSVMGRQLRLATNRGQSM
jgi:DNA helicase TIP49 (TBP-interacting protein)